MPVFEININEDIQRKLDFSDEVVRDAVNQAFFTAAHKAKQTLQAETARKKVFDTGQFNRSWKVVMRDDPSSLSGKAAAVVNTAAYAAVIEYGRRPGGRMPPIRAIKGWVRRKLRPRADQLDGIAWSVARAIARRGLPAKRIIRDAEGKIRKQVASIFLRSFVQHLRHARGPK